MARWLAIGFLALLAAIGSVRSARADDVHYEDFRFGQRAMGMAGAVVGFLTEPEASYYNPGGLGFSGEATFSGSLHFFGVDKRIIRDGMYLPIPGGKQEYGVEDLVSDGFLALPTSSVLTKNLLGGRVVVGFSTFLVSNNEERFYGAVSEKAFVDGVEEESDAFKYDLAIQSSDRTILMGPSVAFRLHEDVGLGGSVFYARRNQTLTDKGMIRQDYTVLEPSSLLADDYLGFDQVEQYTLDYTIEDEAVVARFGVMWKPSSRLSLGATVTSPSIRVGGRGRASYQHINTDPGLLDDDLPEDAEEWVEGFPGYEEGEVQVAARTQYPMSLGFGAALRLAEIMLAASGHFHLPTEYDRLDYPEEVIGGFVNTIVREPTFNAALGMEIMVAPELPLRFGAFTNLASSPPIEGSVEQARLPKVDLVGLSFSVGYADGEDAINLGAEAMFGSGVVTQEQADRLDVTFRDQWRLILFLSGAVGLAESQAKSLYKEDPAPTSPP